MNSASHPIRNLARSFAGALAMALIFAAPATAPAVVTQTLTDGSYQDFQGGTPKGAGITSQGKIVIAPAAGQLAAIEADIIWATVTGPDGRIYLGTGHEGRIMAVTPAGKTEIYCYMDEFEVTALAFGPDGALFAGVSPGGKVYKITGRDQKSLYFDTGEESVWSLAFASDGALFAATGSNGKIFKITERDKGEEYYKADAKNVTGLLWGADGKLFAITHDKTRVLRIDKKGQSFVLHEATQEEGKALAMDRAGNLYVALNNGGSSRDDLFKLPTSAAATVALIAGAALGGADDAAMTALSAAQSSSISAMLDGPKTSGRGATEILRITPEGYASSLWRSPESPIRAMLYDLDTQMIYAAAGSEGRLYSIDDRGDHTLIIATEQKYITALTRLNDKWIMATAKDTAIFTAPVVPAKEGEFMSRVLDASDTVQWGLVRAESERPNGASIEIALRSGNTKETDDTWSEWSKFETLDAAESAAPTAPVARYAQYKARLSAGTDNASPALDSLKIYYAQPNRPPEIRDISITKPGARPGGLPARPASMPVSLPGSQGQGEQQDSGGMPQAIQRPAQPTRANSNAQRMQARWTARDLNGDSLQFDLFLKGEDEPEWIRIEEALDRPLHQLDTSSVPDGAYRMKVVASDLPTNNPGSELTAERISDRFIIDNTGPEFRELKWDAMKGGRVKVSVKVGDKLSLIEEVSYRLNSEAAWSKLVPKDQMFDDMREEFEITLSDIEPGSHILAIQATDAEGNSTVERAIITMKD